jgi:hypothetical protein
MKIPLNLHQTRMDKTREVSDEVRNLAQKTSAKAKNEGQRMYQRAQTAWQRATVAALVSGTLLRHLMRDNERKMRKNRRKVAVSTTPKDAKKALQTRHRHSQRKRAWARRLFRWGLVSGFFVALLFAPMSGAETRKRIGLLWDRYKQYLTLDRSDM